MKIYLAARYSRHAELQSYAKTLEEVGHTITSRWIKGGHQINDEGLSDVAKEEERIRFALEDIEDLDAADVIINFTEKPRSTNSRGGRHVEMGYALGTKAKVVVVIGPRENVFHCLPKVLYFPNWESFINDESLKPLSKGLPG